LNIVQRNLDNKRLHVAFATCLVLALGLPVLFPLARLTFFAPLLIIACYKTSLKKSLWLALLCGIIVDLLSSYTRFGLYSVSYCLTIAVVYQQRRNFFADSLSTLPIMTFFFASLSTLIMAFLIYSIENKNTLSWGWVLTDLLVMPTFDAIYAFSFFILPALFFGKRQRRGKDYFFSK
jgi:rod shape-determining protein MreD